METEIYKGFHIRTGKSNKIERWLIDNQHYYPKVRLRPDDRVLDLGACIGTWARWALDQRILDLTCIEPEEGNFELLKKNVRDSRAELINAAVVPNDYSQGKITLHVSPTACWHSLTPRKRERPKQSVLALRMEDVLNATRPTVIKVNLQGAEYGVMSGPIPSCTRLITIGMYVLWGEDHTDDALALHQHLCDEGFQLLNKLNFESKSLFKIGTYERRG